MHRWLVYRLLDVRLPSEYRWWARDDALGRGYSLRRMLGGFGSWWLMMAVAWLAVSLQEGQMIGLPLPPGDIVWWLAGLWIVFFLVPIPPLDRRSQQRVLRKHEFFPDGTPYEAWPAPDADER